MPKDNFLDSFISSNFFIFHVECVVVVKKGVDFKERTGEIISLAKTAGYTVKKVFSHKKVYPKFFIGKGKLCEIKEYLSNDTTDLVIFESFLDSRQILNLEEELKIPVIDKFDLILNVFEKHAKTREAKLQIELARLKRKIPYIKLSLGRKVKAEHPGFGSSGEYIINSTIKEIKRRISKIEKELKEFENRVEMYEKRRKEIGKVVSLVGYTNVGKTSLLNVLTGANKEAKDELFTTLSTKTSKIKARENIFINDTIGFIRNLPHELIYAFRATLKDILYSDLILLVFDASDNLREFLRKKKVCEDTLIRIGADKIPHLYVLNKIDIADESNIAEKEKILGRCIKVSAKEKIGIDELKNEIIGRLDGKQ